VRRVRKSRLYQEVGHIKFCHVMMNNSLKVIAKQVSTHNEHSDCEYSSRSLWSKTPEVESGRLTMDAAT